jgi:hypothetical protein
MMWISVTVLSADRPRMRTSHAMGLQAEAFGRGDAGFGSTSRMVLEAGLTLALQVTATSHSATMPEAEAGCLSGLAVPLG